MDLKEGSVTGYSVLVVAILLNIVAGFLGFPTWYVFFNQMVSEGFVNAFSDLNVLSFGFLFLFYPLIVGLTAVNVLKLID